MASRVQSSSGFNNVCWRRESSGGNTEKPGRDNLRDSADEKADHEQLNDERGTKPLPVSLQRDGAESDKACREG